jgi:NAD(P)-dependent dehydrogenase (short-subunit alcohol dehydrogenase family)
MTTTLVTGATRGVGLELSRRLAEAGHTVYLGARDLGRGREVAEPIGARAVSIDVTEDASVHAAVDRLRQEVGALDVLVNNAGISGTQRPPAEADVDDLQTVLATNVVGATRVLAACTPLTEFTGRPTDSVDLEAFRRAGGRTVDEAVAILVAMATIGPDGSTGTFVGNDGPLPW